MKRIYVSLLFLLSFVLPSNAQFLQQFFDGADTLPEYSVQIALDTASQNVWQIGKPQKIIFDSAATQPNVIVTDTINPFPINNISRFIAIVPVIAATNVTFTLQWKQKLDLDSAKDGGIVEVSLDQGLTWVNCMTDPNVKDFYGFDNNDVQLLPNGEYGFSGADSQWKDVWLCYPPGWLTLSIDTVMFRFTLVSDSTQTNQEGWMIDNIYARKSLGHTIKNVAYTSYVNIFPNPSKDMVQIALQNVAGFHKIEKMELIDEAGKVVGTWKDLPTTYKIKTDKYPDGLYYLKVQTNLRSETVPLSIRKQ
jgi:hypothetical protein